MHYLLFTVGTEGDLNPYLGLGSELAARGHRVSLMTNASFEPLVREAGLELIPVGEAAELDRYVQHPDYFHPGRTWQLALKACFLGPMRSTYDAIARQHAAGPVAVVSAAWGLGARIANEKLGVPLVTTHLEPHNIRSMYQTGKMPPPMVLGDWVPRWLKRLQFWVADRWFVDPRLAPEVNAFRSELGLLPATRLTNQWWNSPQKILGLYPSWLVPPQPDWPSQLELTGFPLWDRTIEDESINQAVEFAKQHQPLVFTAGSNNLQADEFFQSALSCCQQMQLPGILVGNRPITLPNESADLVKQFTYVKFSKVLPHASALVHHGGAGTAAQALAAGVPQLVLPSVHGTPDLAQRLQRLGVARWLRPSQFRSGSALAALQGLLDSAEVASRCQHYRQAMTKENGIARACDVIESVSRD